MKGASAASLFLLALCIYYVSIACVYAESRGGGSAGESSQLQPRPSGRRRGRGGSSGWLGGLLGSGKHKDY